VLCSLYYAAEDALVGSLHLPTFLLPAFAPPLSGTSRVPFYLVGWEDVVARPSDAIACAKEEISGVPEGACTTLRTTPSYSVTRLVSGFIGGSSSSLGVGLLSLSLIFSSNPLGLFCALPNASNELFKIIFGDVKFCRSFPTRLTNVSYPRE